ncbi:MAG TPA: hemerythrin domain-containing protein [Sphingobium sp.]|nr:hemerythrin domain-containing protein [Sphingobium sp.]
MASQAQLSEFRMSREIKRALVTAGVGAGFALAGSIGRKLVAQAPSALAGDWDQALAREHRKARALFDKLQDSRGMGKTRRSMLLTQLKNALGKHALEEEDVIYPAMRDAGMATEADNLTSEHGYVKQYLYDLADLVSDDAAFLEKLASFRSDIEKHMEEEEETLFPELKRKLDAAATKTLTRRMNMEGLKLA